MTAKTGSAGSLLSLLALPASSHPASGRLKVADLHIKASKRNNSLDAAFHGGSLGRAHPPIIPASSGRSQFFRPPSRSFAGAAVAPAAANNNAAAAGADDETWNPADGRRRRQVRDRPLPVDYSQSVKSWGPAWARCCTLL